MNNPPIYKWPPFNKWPLSIRFLFLIWGFFSFTGIATRVALLFLPKLFGIEDPVEFLSKVPVTPAEVNAFLFIQTIGTEVAGFLLTALMFAKIEWGTTLPTLRLNISPRIKMVALVIVSIFAAQFFMEWLVDLNKAIPLPKVLQPLKDIEKDTGTLTNALLNFKGIGQLIWVSLTLAVAPAVCEEVFFRGVIMGDMLKQGVRPWVAITLSGLVFALSHFEFSNTLAIWLLGAFLGYLYYVSGSLWLSIAAHFFNNFLQVFFKYLFNAGRLGSDITEIPTPIYATVISIIVFGACIFIFNRWKTPVTLEEEIIEEEISPSE